jgi:chromosome segregation ATPase
MAEKLLANTRELLATRNEEARTFEREVMEAKRARSAAETLRAEIETMLKSHENQIKDLEQSRATLTERNTALTDSLKYRESQLAQAEEQRRAAASELARLDNDLRTSRMTYEKRIDELLGMLERERLNRQVVEGALDTTRSERAQLQHEVYKLRRATQRGSLPEELAEPPTREDRPGRSADAA